MTVRRSRSAVDTYVRSDKPSTNYQQSSRLGVKGSDQYAYVYFTRPFPLGATIISAKLTVQTYEMTGSKTRVMTCRNTGERTSLSRLNWTNRPVRLVATNSTVTKTGALPGGTKWEFDVTHNMQVIADGEPWYGFVLWIDENTQRWIYGEENATRGPLLEVEWSDAPSEPENLVPSGNGVVGKQKPVLRFDYIDVSGNTDLASVQVQIHSSNSWSSPAFDSGIVNTSVPELDLSDTAYAGLPSNGNSAWWRVKVKDGAGLWSDWSDAVRMRYIAKGTVNVTSPGELFYDNTQVVSWSLAGGTQRAYQVLVTRTNKYIDEILYNSGKITANATSMTLPEGVIRWDDKPYRFIVRVWDQHDRVSTPGSPAYAFKNVYTYYDKDTTIPGVENLTAVSDKPYPFVNLSWNWDGSLPDGWRISRNGEIVETRDYDEVAFVGGKYRWSADRYAIPHQENRYVVRPVVNGNVGPSISAFVTPKPYGIWLVTDTDALCIVGNDSGSFEMTEHITEHEVLGATRSTIVSQGIGGYKGEITGQLVGNLPGMDMSAKEWKDIALLFKEEAAKGKTFRLVVGDMNIPVKIGNLVPSPRPEEEIMYDIKFSFWQHGELPFQT